MAPKIVIIGAGKMGKAMDCALKKQFPPKNIRACDRGCDLNKCLKTADVVIFAVKPQDFNACVDSININLSQKLIISIMAGVTIEKIRKKTGALKIIRSMPNLPLQVGAGLTAWIATKTIKEKTLIRKIFGCFGKEFEVNKENKLNLITALSGSGPAYFFYFCELLEKNARKMGFNKNEAKLISETTFLGAAELLKKTGCSAEELRRAVTSKGGTTEAAFKYLFEYKFGAIFGNAIRKAAERFKRNSKFKIKKSKVQFKS